MRKLCNTKSLIYKIFLLTIVSYFSLHVTDYTLHNLYAQDKIIAIVNKDVITQKDLRDFMNFMKIQLSKEYSGNALENHIQSMKSDLLNKLIEDKIILQEAKKERINIDDNRIKAKIDEIKKDYPSEEIFLEILKRQGMVLADIESKIKEQMLTYLVVENKIRREILINPVEITKFYQEHVEEFKQPELKVFNSIDTRDKDLAEEISTELKKNPGFNEIAKRYSLSIDTLEVKQNQLKKDIEEKIFRLKPGGISKPVKIGDKYYIFQLKEIIPEQQQQLSEVQNRIYEFLYEQEMQEKLTKWLNELKNKSYIKIM
ncbi:MAG: peptidyl-prolyl cis-trans isomerase [Candidatus Omnitrophota bacterium]